MIVKLEFNLPEDKDDLHMAQRGHKYVFALIDFANRLREGMKYHGKDWDEISEVFYSILEDKQIDVHEEVQ